MRAWCLGCSDHYKISKFARRFKAMARTARMFLSRPSNKSEWQVPARRRATPSNADAVHPSTPSIRSATRHQPLLDHFDPAPAHSTAPGAIGRSPRRIRGHLGHRGAVDHTLRPGASPASGRESCHRDANENVGPVRTPSSTTPGADTPAGFVIARPSASVWFLHSLCGKTGEALYERLFQFGERGGAGNEDLEVWDSSSQIRLFL